MTKLQDKIKEIITSSVSIHKDKDGLSLTVKGSSIEELQFLIKKETIKARLEGALEHFEKLHRELAIIRTEPTTHTLVEKIKELKGKLEN